MAEQMISADAIRALIEKGKRHRPELAARLEKAAMIVLFRTIECLDEDADRWCVQSECRPDASYEVDAARRTCSCQDWLRHQAPGGACKHVLAVATLQRVQADEAARRDAEEQAAAWLLVAATPGACSTAYQRRERLGRFARAEVAA